MKTIHLFLFLRLVFGIPIPKKVQKNILIKILKHYKENEHYYCTYDVVKSIFPFYTHYHRFDYYIPIFNHSNAKEFFPTLSSIDWWDFTEFIDNGTLKRNIAPRVMFINWCIGQLSK